MARRIPTWLFLLCLLLGGVGTVFYGWAVKEVFGGNPHFGAVRDAIAAVANFPDLVKETLRETFEGAESPFFVVPPTISLSEFRPLRTRSGIRVEGLLARSDPAALARAPGWRVLVGPFVIDGELQFAVLILSPELEVEKSITIREDEPQGEGRHAIKHEFIQGFSILKDGSMVMAFEGGHSLQRIDRCGRKIWSIEGNFNHAVSAEFDGDFLWTLDGWSMDTQLVRIVTATGKVSRRIPVVDIISANQDIDILDLGVDTDWNYEDAANIGEKWWTFDPFHLNDIEPLPPALANNFQLFQPGDLLLSARNLNLVFVMDPRSLKIKWWHYGSWRRQHDPDWQPTGDITVLDNKPGSRFSRIVRIDPNSHQTSVLFDGRMNDFFTYQQGKHQIIPSGDILITSATQGRVFEVDSSGNMVFDLVNVDLKDRRHNYRMSEAVWLPPNFIGFSKMLLCPGQAQ